MDVWIVKNEIIDLLFHELFYYKNKINICVIFTSIVYKEEGGVRNKLHNFIYNSFLYYKLLSKFDYLIVSNKTDLAFLESKINKKCQIKLIEYSIDKFISDKTNKLNNKKNQKNIVVGFIGRLEDQKGILDFLKIASNLRLLDYEFIIIGDGSRGEEVEKFCLENSKVKYIGFIKPESIAQYYLKCDLVLVTSKWETFCYVALESQSLGIPVLSYNISGPNEIIQNNISGKIVENIDDMTFEIMNFKNASWRYFNKDIFLEKYSEHKFIEKYLQLLN